jgi:hypothetical protein
MPQILKRHGRAELGRRPSFLARESSPFSLVQRLKRRAAKTEA